jgi:hypothetical protein
MTINRRGFLKLTGVGGAGLFAVGDLVGNDAPAPKPSVQKTPAETFTTELFLDNELIEESPGVSRRLHKPRKHLLNPVVRCERWCDGNDIQPYTTMYDKEDKLFKMWARTGSDWKSKRLDGNAAYMLYFTSTDGVHWDRPNLGVLTVGGRRDHNIVFASDIVLRARAAEFPDKKVVLPTQPAAPQGKKAFFWGVNKHPHPRDASEKFVALAIVQDHRRAYRHLPRRHSLGVREHSFLADAARRVRQGGRLPDAFDVRPGQAEVGHLSSDHSGIQRAYDRG